MDDAHGKRLGQTLKLGSMYRKLRKQTMLAVPHSKCRRSQMVSWLDPRVLTYSNHTQSDQTAQLAGDCSREAATWYDSHKRPP